MAPDDLRAIYQVLHDRYANNALLEWQVAVYTIAAQAALLVGVLAAPTGSPTWVFGSAALVVGVVGALVARRIELTGWLDREQLDVIEAELARGRPDLLLHHGDSFRQRVTRRGGLKSSQRTALHRLDARVTRFVPPGAMLAGLMFLLGITGLAAGVAETEHTSSHPARSSTGSQVTRTVARPTRTVTLPPRTVP